MSPFGRNFLPGPTDVHPEVLEATLGPMFSTFGPKMVALLEEAQPALQELFGTTQPVFTSTSAATGLMEAAVRNGVRHRVLVVCGGYFGEMFARVAEGCGKEVIRVTVPPGQTLEAEQLTAFLDGPAVDAVALAHSESSTGALAPLEELARVVHAEPDRMLLVDAVTSIGAMRVEMDRWGLDFVFTGSQKALALPPGLAFGAASERLLERATTLSDRGFYLSVTHLVGAARRNLPVTTPALPVYYALQRQLRRIATAGGLPARAARHQRLATMLHTWVESVPSVQLLAPAARRSPTVSALQLPEGRRAAEIVAEMGERGWLIATGLPPIADRVIRIGHMGDLEPDHLVGLLAELQAVLERA